MVIFGLAWKKEARRAQPFGHPRPEGRGERDMEPRYNAPTTFTNTPRWR